MQNKNLNKDFFQGYSNLQQEFLKIPLPEDFFNISFFFNAPNTRNNYSCPNVHSFSAYIQDNVKLPYLCDVYNIHNFIDFKNKCFVIAKEIAATRAQYVEQYFQLKENQALLFLGSGRQMFLTKESFEDFFDIFDTNEIDRLFSEMKYSNVLFLVSKENDTYFVTHKFDLESEEISNLS